MSVEAGSAAPAVNGAQAGRLGPLFFVCMAVLSTLVVALAWVSDDAFITLRTVDNFVNGHGLRWNTVERVQAYTHPLWMAAQIPLYWVSRSPVIASLTLSITCSVVAIGLALRQAFRGDPWLAVALVAMPLAFSRPVLEYATSGLETPATFLFLVLFARALNDGTPLSDVARRIGVLTMLAALNRLDTLLFFAPVGVLILHTRDRRVIRDYLLPIVIGLGAWELFSLTYYGFPFPNTFYAKVSDAIPRADYIAQGGRYLEDLIVHHPTSAAVIALALGFGVWRGFSQGGLDTGKHAVGPRVLALSAGIGLYGSYVIWVGGDHMSGRFWAAPIFAAVLLLHRCVSSLDSKAVRRGVALLVALGLPALSLLAPHVDRAESVYDVESSGIVDERAYYAEHNALVNMRKTNGPANMSWSQTALEFRARAESIGSSAEAPLVVTRAGAIGMVGFYAGPKVTVIDAMGLADPLLARLPPADLYTWRIGHLMREVPVGYDAMLETGNVEALPPTLQDYYRNLGRATRDSLWSVERIRAIVALNTGLLDPMLDTYMRPVPLTDRTIASVATPVPDGAPWDDPRVIRLPQRSSLTLRSESPMVASGMEIGVEAYGIYSVALLQGETTLRTFTVQPSAHELETPEAQSKVIHTRRIDLPSDLVGKPFDRVVIEPRGGWGPVGGDGRYSLGHVRFF